MILIDPRAGSAPLEPLLQSLHAPCRLEQTPYGDFSWEGNGPHGRAKIGVEYKTLKDALACMTGGRFAGHQLPGLLAQYDFAYLLVEGIWRSHPDTGLLESAIPGGWRRVVLGQRPFTGLAFDNWLLSLTTQTPLRVVRTDHQRATAERIVGMYHWFQGKWRDHDSLHVLYTPPPSAAFVLKPKRVHRIAAQFDGVGWDRGGAIAAKFRTPLDFALALQGELEEVPGIGKGIAAGIIRQWQSED